jgi:hypothetical protein
MAPAAWLIVGLAAPAAAQQRNGPPETAPATYAISPEYRTIQSSALASQRKLLLSFADSLPESLYRDKATPAQRDFVQQVHHIVSANAFISHRWIKLEPWKDGDTAQVFKNRQNLKAYINQQYDALDAMLKNQSDADRNERVKFFDGRLLPRWEIWDELNQHAMWTAGQVVANFRKHGMAPPSFVFF